MELNDFVNFAVDVMEASGVAVVLGGALYVTGVFLLSVAGARRRRDAFTGYRHSLGRAILLGLEFLVAADIVRTVAIDLTLESVGTLGLLVLVRTFLSLALEVEMTGTWPWWIGRKESKAGASERGG